MLTNTVIMRIEIDIRLFQNHLPYRDNLHSLRIRGAPVCEEDHRHHELQ